MNEALTLRELVLRLLRHWILMGSVFAVVVAAVVVWTLLSTPLYQSAAVLRITDRTPEMQLAEQLSSLPGADLMGLGRDDLDTEIGVLRSWRITQAVVDSLALTVQVAKPAGVRSRVVELVAVGDPDREGTLTLRRQGGGEYRARVTEPGEERLELGVVEIGGELEWAGYRLLLSPDLAADPPGTVRVEILRRHAAVQRLREDLEVRRQEGGSRLVEVSYLLPDREMAAAVVNGIVGEYVAYKGATERGEARFTVEELRVQVAEYARRLADAEEALRRYQETHQIVAPEEQATQQVRRVAELQLQVDALEVERGALGDLLTLIGERAAPGGGGASAYRQLATFPSLISNRAIQDLLMVLLGLENERSALLVRRTEENLDVRRLTDRIAELEGQLFRLGGNYLEGLEGQLASASEALGQLSQEMEALPAQEMGYLRLVRDRTMLGEAYLMLERQLRLAEVQDAIRDEGVRIVDVGLVPHEDDPEYPKPLVNLFLGVVLGGALGVGAGLLRDLWEG